MNDAIFDNFMRPIIAKEGAQLTNNPKDRGGVTKFGVTEARARAAGYAGAMADLSLDRALVIYRLFYWQQPQFDLMASVDAQVAQFLLDIGINCGQARAGQMLQRALNVLNRGAASWPDLTADGMCGAMTRAALAAFISQRGMDGRDVLMDMLRALASVRYVEIAERDPSQEEFEYGWQKNRAFG